jgi:catechol 2,3-dioxygenase-like lactoylglutathione lyase family enzyme
MRPDGTGRAGMASATPEASTGAEYAVMGVRMTRIQHVKIPVTDLRRSVAWYTELLHLVPFREFVEQGAVRGAALRSPEADVVLALRERRFCANQPDSSGSRKPGHASVHRVELRHGRTPHLLQHPAAARPTPGIDRPATAARSGAPGYIGAEQSICRASGGTPA